MNKIINVAGNQPPSTIPLWAIANGSDAIPSQMCAAIQYLVAPNRLIRRNHLRGLNNISNKMISPAATPQLSPAALPPLNQWAADRDPQAYQPSSAAVTIAVGSPIKKWSRVDCNNNTLASLHFAILRVERVSTFTSAMLIVPAKIASMCSGTRPPSQIRQTIVIIRAFDPKPNQGQVNEFTGRTDGIGVPRCQPVEPREKGTETLPAWSIAIMVGGATGSFSIHSLVRCRFPSHPESRDDVFNLSDRLSGSLDSHLARDDPGRHRRNGLDGPGGHSDAAATTRSIEIPSLGR